MKGVSCLLVSNYVRPPGKTGLLMPVLCAPAAAVAPSMSPDHLAKSVPKTQPEVRPGHLVRTCVVAVVLVREG